MERQWEGANGVAVGGGQGRGPREGAKGAAAHLSISSSCAPMSRYLRFITLIATKAGAAAAAAAAARLAPPPSTSYVSRHSRICENAPGRRAALSSGHGTAERTSG